MLSRRRVVVLVIVLVVIVGGALLYLSSNNPNGKSKTVGVILVGPRSDYGWENVEGGEYAETWIGNDRIILFDNLNEDANPGLMLHDVVSQMLSSGARAFFLSSYLPQDEPIARKFPNTVFVENVSYEWNVKAMLPTLVIVTTSQQGPPEPGTTTGDITWWMFLVGGLVAMALVVTIIGFYQARKAPPS
jgi:hypothetical protein